MTDELIFGVSNSKSATVTTHTTLSLDHRVAPDTSKSLRKEFYPKHGKTHNTTYLGMSESRKCIPAHAQAHINASPKPLDLPFSFQVRGLYAIITK